jgi:alpha-amylase
MKSICLYLHVHQPYRVKNYTIFDIGKTASYFEENPSLHSSNEHIFNKVAQKSYIPTNALLKKLLGKYKDFNINLSITGTFIEQALENNLNILETFQQLTQNNKCEILAETYYHSLASMYSNKELLAQTKQHKEAIKKYFSQEPNFFRNTELIYSNKIAQAVEDMGFTGMITEGHEKFLGWKSSNYLYKTNTIKGMSLLLKNYKLSDDIAWRFSDKGWKDYPLNAKKYLHWIDNTPGDTINLFMDYETIGEHQWKDTGIFEFIEDFIVQAIDRGYKFSKISDLAKKLTPKDTLDIIDPVSWADENRDTSAWTENSMQQDTLNKIYQMESKIKSSKNKKLIKKWRLLQTSDHYYYMCTKWFNDGDAHKYFSPYENPHKAYNSFNNAYIDLNLQLEEVLQKKKWQYTLIKTSQKNTYQIGPTYFHFLGQRV